MVPKYVFDLDQLRKRYGISVEDAPPVPKPVDTIDCEADINSWESQNEEAAVEAAVAAAELQAEATKAQGTDVGAETDMENEYEVEEAVAAEIEDDMLMAQAGVTGQKRPRE